MKNLWLLPTDKPSKLFKDVKETLIFNKEWSEFPFGRTNQNIYITNDEEIKIGDYYCNERLNQVFQAIRKSGYNTLDREFKIILTTDQNLINGGIQAIDDEFLEWFVMNPSCEEVDFKKEHDDSVPYLKMRYCKLYKIIIPKKEPKQETLEEINSNWSLEKALEFALSKFKKRNNSMQGIITWESILKVLKAGVTTGHKFGVKPQTQRMYSEEEVIEILRQRSIAMSTSFAEFQEFLFKKDMEWFEKNKKFKK